MNKLIDNINSIKGLKKQTVIAIDGKCASGKTTLAAQLVHLFGAACVHMDDFFLPRRYATTDRLSVAGGNSDTERFLEEVCPHLGKGEGFSYRRFECSKQDYGNTINIPASDVIIIEGSYSHHPSLRSFYDLTVFLTVTPEEQKKRLVERGETPASLKAFRDKWIPLENTYFNAFHIKEKSDIILDSPSYDILR